MNEYRDAIYQGHTLDISKEDWPKERSVVQAIAGEFVDQGDGLRAMIALQEVQRLDRLHNFTLTDDT